MLPLGRRDPTMDLASCLPAIKAGPHDAGIVHHDVRAVQVVVLEAHVGVWYEVGAGASAVAVNEPAA